MDLGNIHFKYIKYINYSKNLKCEISLINYWECDMLDPWRMTQVTKYFIGDWRCFFMGDAFDGSFMLDQVTYLNGKHL